jgi:hypothetical protein
MHSALSVLVTRPDRLEGKKLGQTKGSYIIVAPLLIFDIRVLKLSFH